PVLEKSWGVLSGLGWIGKNTLLLNKQFGSFFFIGTIISSVELSYDIPLDNDYCGTCTKCLNSCPTNALIAPRLLDSAKCISYQTIESKKEIPQYLEKKLSIRIFGCDICQDVCPWNQKLSRHNIDEFEPHPNLRSMTRKDWNNLSKENYNELFRKSAVKRSKYPKLVQNIQSAAKKNG
ncbi:MAG: tRNA epoxyqueuosine(34) reductase QueG, partial [Bacteroidales bacterium]|nr:tRNA epoxyqueuosine(34) reductase QueG [Bacteroidales bacterium]